MKFERGKYPKVSLGIGIKDEKGYNITGLDDEKMVLTGIDPDEVYMITHSGSRSVSGFCSGKKVTKVLIALMSKGYSNYQYKWIWSPNWGSSGGNLFFYYSTDGDFWTDSNNTKGYNFSRMNEDSIMEL